MEALEQQKVHASRVLRFDRNTVKEGRENYTLGFLQSRIDLLERYWREFQDGHNKLSAIDGFEESDYSRDDTYSLCEVAYSKALGRLYDERARLQPREVQAPSISGLPTTTGVNLPKIQLPTFSGRWDEWEPFRDVFRSMIHASPSLSDVQKLHYLKTSVTNDAKTAIDGLSITSANYHTAWDILYKRYEHKRMLVYHHMTAIAKSPGLKTESAAGLQAHLDRIVKSRASLEALGISVDQWDDWLGFFLIRGLDPETKKDWEKSIGDSTELPTWEALVAFVRGRVRALSSSDSREGTRQSRSSSRTNLLATSTQRSARCSACHGNHYLGGCPEFAKKTPAGRSQLVKRLNCCWNCLNCAPYLAIRTLHQLARDHQESHQDAAAALMNNTYVDDILTGSDDIPSAQELQAQLSDLLQLGGFRLKKWVSNDATLLNPIDKDARLRPEWHHFEKEGTVKTLGVAWDPVNDNFRFAVPSTDMKSTTTKRSILSTIARFFDPAGWIGPITIIAKLLMQHLWRQKLGWDEPVPSEDAAKWQEFHASLQAVSEIKIPRWISTQKSDAVEYHVFADASQVAYAAALYSRVKTAAGMIHVRLLASKTRVAPIKQISIPRLELCAAHIAMKLLTWARTELGVQKSHSYAWSDSHTVLHWLRAEPDRWTTFVANRVSEIQREGEATEWRYVPSAENPADLASRGVPAATLYRQALWWNGPPWLSKSEGRWPVLPSFGQKAPDIDVERRAHRTMRALLCGHMQRNKNPFQGFSRLERLCRVIVWCRRARHWRLPAQERRIALKKPIDATEIRAAYQGCVRWAQTLSFSKELSHLRNGRSVGSRHKLSSLTPFVDTSGLLRVGGRLAQAPLPYDERHPVILDRDCPLAGLIIDQAHRACLHGGFALTYSRAIRTSWLIGGRVRVKAHIRKCVTCARVRAHPSTQLMGALPPERTTPTRPFFRCGLDYAGPFKVKSAKGRGLHASKAYLAIFVCLSTKAAHLELVGDLTTPSFLGALRRFVGRRGKPLEIWSDNATTFRGADAELRAMLQELRVEWQEVTDTLALEGITWRFIPPAAPHFGGLWEAAVKSAKVHLKRVAGERLLTYEEFNTLLIYIEMCLNSRPLTVMSGEPEDNQVLTPGHFLIGAAMDQIPEMQSDSPTFDHFSHWRLVKAMRDQFWSRWAREYLNTLRQRAKWKQVRPNLQRGDIILDPSLLRARSWPLGRVMEVHEGRDGSASHFEGVRPADRYESAGSAPTTGGGR